MNNANTNEIGVNVVMSAYAKAVIEIARKEQSKRVMPLIGNLIDQWDAVPNDIRSLLVEQSPGLCAAMASVTRAMEAD